jgi:hypothetical protein
MLCRPSAQPRYPGGAGLSSVPTNWPIAVAGTMKRTQPKIIELGAKTLQEALQCAETTLNGEHYEAIKAVVESYAYIAELVGEKNITIRRLQKILFGASTEKTAAVTGAATDSEAGPLDDGDAATDPSGETGS